MPTRPCWVEIQTRLLEENYRFLLTLAAPQMELLAIVKADAYGHGLELCAPAVVRAGARWLGVTCVEEGVAARAVCPEAHVLVVSGAFPGEGKAVVANRLTAVAWEPWQLDELEGAARAAGLPAQSLPIHLEIDTGMSRQGVSPEGIAPVLARFGSGSPLRLEAVMTHLFAADEADGAVTRKQMVQMDKAVAKIEAAGLKPEWLNVGSSAALLAGQAATVAELAARWGLKPMMRPGLALYGLVQDFDPPFAPNEEPEAMTAARVHLQPVLSWKTRVAGVRTVPAGSMVGYNGTFVTTEPARLALLAVGYADGLDRRLARQFSVLVRGRRAPFAGRISMDQSVVDVSGIPGVEAGDEVVILGAQGSESITAFDHAKATATIPWEVFTRIGRRVGRVGV
jgi:alanine racemase